MPNPYPVALRERAVRAYEDGTDTYQVMAARFAISVNTLVRWVQRARTTGEVAPRFSAGRGTAAPCVSYRLDFAAQRAEAAHVAFENACEMMAA